VNRNTELKLRKIKVKDIAFIPNLRLFCVQQLIITNYSNQQMHIKQLKITHNIYNSYMLQCQGDIFRESKVQRFESTNTTILVLH